MIRRPRSSRDPSALNRALTAATHAERAFDHAAREPYGQRDRAFADAAEAYDVAADALMEAAGAPGLNPQERALLRHEAAHHLLVTAEIRRWVSDGQRVRSALEYQVRTKEPHAGFRRIASRVARYVDFRTGEGASCMPSLRLKNAARIAALAGWIDVGDEGLQLMEDVDANGRPNFGRVEWLFRMTIIPKSRNRDFLTPHGERRCSFRDRYDLELFRHLLRDAAEGLVRQRY